MCIDARRFDPASVRTSVPLSKSNAARPILPGSFAPGGEPLEAAGDHQMDDEEELVFECEDDALAEAAELGDVFAFEVARSGLDRAEDEGAGEPELVRAFCPGRRDWSASR